MLAEVTKDVIVIADSPQSGFVNLYEDPAKTETFIKKVNTGQAVGKLTGVVKMVAQIRYVEVVYDERSLTNWVADKAFVNASIVTNTSDLKTKPYFVTADNVNVRNTPSTADSTNIVAKANKGDLIGYSSGEKSGIFTKLLYAKGSGTVYVATEYLTTDKTKASTNSTTTTTSTTPTANTSKKVEVVTDQITGEKTLSVFGAKINVSNSSLITYAVVVFSVVMAGIYLKRKFKK